MSSKKIDFNPDDFHTLKKKKEGEWVKGSEKLGIIGIIQDLKKVLEIEQKRLLEVAKETKALAMNRVKQEQKRRYGNYKKRK